MATTDHDSLVGRTVGQYQILARIGGGGMGVVYTARASRLGRVVALKFLPPQWSDDDSAKQRFVREAQAASATNHPNICTIHDIETADDGQLFIVMAYYDGETLKKRLESGPLPIEEALDIATQISEGLAKAHAQGVVHRDIKPGNIILTEDGVRILDFGLATFVDALKLTIENAPLGTVAYMSPEQVRGLPADARTDVWATGVVLYEMLTGHPPFRGSHTEAIGYAVRNETPSPIRAERSEVPEEVEQLVFRAFHKEPGIRYQSGRDLARALRQVRGLSVPMDLHTKPVQVMERPVRAAKWWKRSISAAAMVALLAAILTVWSLTRLEPPTVIVAPLVNLTGMRELEPFRLALTHTLLLELSETPDLHPLSYTQTLGRIRRFIADGPDVSGPDAMRALTGDMAGAQILVPTLLYENELWRGRVEIRDSTTNNRVGVIETEGMASSLPKEVAYRIVVELADRVRSQYRRFHLFASRSARSPGARLRTLDAAKAYEAGIRAYDELEYANARAMFTDASRNDPNHPMPLAWLSRTARLMGHANESREAAERALRLVNDQTPWVDSTFVSAIVAEARDDQGTAAARYTALANREADRSTWLMELGALFDRSGQDEKAVGVYQQALRADDRLIRPHLELCRLNAPSRLSASAYAEEYGRRALTAYRRLGDRVMEAQALFCLTDVLRHGDDTKREEARRYADTAVQILQATSTHRYSLARAFNYAALAADAQRHYPEALAWLEKSLAAARDVGNAVLEPLVLMNLGVAHEAVGNRARAFDLYQQSIKEYEGLGDEQRAAQYRANVASILIDNGGRPEEGLKYIRNALPVFRNSSNKDFELYCLRAIASYDRNAGLLKEAEIELVKAVGIATQSGLSRKVAGLEIDLARTLIERGDYEGARTQLVATLGDGSGPDATEARLHLAAAQTYLGEFDLATANVVQASADVEQSGRRGLLPVVHFVNGELAYQADRRKDARKNFANSAALWTDEFPDPASVEALAYVGLLDGLDGKTVEAERAIRRSLEQARLMGRIAMQVRARVFLARVYVLAGRPHEAIGILNDSPTDRDRTVNPEILALAHYWRSRALSLVGDSDRSRREAEQARDTADGLLRRVPESRRRAFAARIDIRPLVQ